MHLYEINGKSPRIDPNYAYIADDVKIIGDVSIEEGVTIFHSVVLEGFPCKITIGKYSNIQSGTIVHGITDVETIVGPFNTIGHQCVIHGCQLGEYVTIGIGSTIMGNSKIGNRSTIGAGSLVTENKSFPENSLIFGSPAKEIRKLKQPEIDESMKIAKGYYEKGLELRRDLKKI